MSSIEDFINTLDLATFCGTDHDLTEATEREKKGNVLMMQQDEFGYTFHVSNPYQISYGPETAERWKFDIPNTLYLACALYESIPLRHKNSLIQLTPTPNSRGPQSFMFSGSEPQFDIASFIDKKQALLHSYYNKARRYDVMVSALENGDTPQLLVGREPNYPLQFYEQEPLFFHILPDTTVRKATQYALRILRSNDVTVRHDGLSSNRNAVNTMRLLPKRNDVDLYDALEHSQHDLTTYSTTQ